MQQFVVVVQKFIIFCNLKWQKNCGDQRYKTSFRPNSGCSLQIRKHLQENQIIIIHPIEFLDYTIQDKKLTGM
ncbi:hypothetical protein [Richelia intracellularis]|uniref:hypothetical protein n=1 Tax=Richelia intracellularis TaxID=1164990 RepID=UPI0005C7CADD|nr:hypothetical protein [Richelia intracellularis]HAE05404.1 hypothetical protein [Richelia sp.]